MKRQVIIRSIAIAFAGIAASVFATKELLIDRPASGTEHAAGVTTAPDSVKGASLIGAGTEAASNRTAANAPDLQISAERPDEPLPMLVFEPPTAVHAPAQEMASELSLSALDGALTPQTERVLREDFRPELALVEAGSMDDSLLCDPDIRLTPLPEAMVQLQVAARCQGEGRIVVSHADLAFSAFLDADGLYQGAIPALSSEARVYVFLPDDNMLQASALVPELGDHHRVVLQWMGDYGLGLHAFHHNASFGEAGHVFSENPHDPELAAAFLITLGDARGPEPMLAQIYSIPVDQRDAARLELEVTSDKRSCGRDIMAHVMQIAPGLQGDMSEVSFAMPACDSEVGLAILNLPFQTPRDTALDAPEPTTPELAQGTQ
ncbi:MAG: hypothetical protein JJT99_03120 [Rhodobacteraceae bacterium]|nr:hypothetical protein [Paracoccaceae bacterium]